MPAVVFVAPLLPPRIAETLPFFNANAAVLVNVPPLPLIVPSVRVTAATVSLFALRSKIPPLTHTLLLSSKTLLAPSANVPPLITVVPEPV